MKRWTTIVVAALLAAPVLGQRAPERALDRSELERTAPERATDRTRTRPTDDLRALRQEVQRLRQQLERLQNERSGDRMGPHPRGPRNGPMRDRLRALRARADQNHDGRLDRAERDAAREVIQRRARAGRERDVAPRSDTPRDRETRRLPAQAAQPRR